MTDRSERIRRASGVLDVDGGLEWEAEALVMPAAPALLTDAGGVVVRATGQAVRLAGETTSAALIGRRLTDLVVGDGPVAKLKGRDGEVSVRPVSWPHEEDERLRVTVLVDVSDLVAADPTPQSGAPANDERTRLIDAQRMAKVGSWIYYPGTGEFYRSPVLEELFAASGAADTGNPADLVDAVHPEDRQKAEDFERQIRRIPEGSLIEVELRDRGGSRVYLCTARAEYGGDGRLERLQGTVQDVTEHRYLERRLRDERRKLHDAQRVARLGTWEWDPATDNIRLSEMLHEIIGKSSETVISFESYVAAVHPDDRVWVRNAWRPLVEEHDPIEVEHRYLRGDGAVRILRMHGTAVRDADGRTLLVGTAQDVTEQRTAVTRMERSSQRFTDLVAVTPVGIGLFDQAERLVDANDALCDLLGYRLDQLRGMTAQDMTHPDEDGMRLQTASHQGGRGSGRRKVPQRLLIRSDGEPVYCELHVALSVQDDGTRFWLVVFQDITERRRAAEALRYQATHDDLTGLPNRAAVKDLLGHLLGRADSAEGVAVLFCDIDNFKRVNDSLGHDAGDELLVALARRLEGGLPDGCTAARLSGDEFVIICRDIGTVGGVDQLATRVAGLLRTAVPVHGQLIRVSASIGAAVPNGSGAGGEDLLRFADAAMFEAKRRGAGKVSLASPALMASADRQLHLEGQLRDALNNDGLTLYYQPVVSSDGSIVTAEALVRWPHPDRGLLSPDAFLPVAEQGDLLRELDRWVLRTALKEAASWPSSNGRQVGVAVNLAGLVPGGPDFVDTVADVVADVGIDWHRVILELVETALVDLPSRTRHAMGELVQRGVRFAVDDFGTGYSSLARLKDLPAQIIKVDRRFVSGVGGDASDFAVARAVVDMARAMGRQCVAEGVETATQFHVLCGVGVDAYQGWLFSRPIPAREFRTILSMGPLHVPRSS
ncbi:PAS domain S-box-containing protein/diguanylate cyclase (GGDEF)-like protein [Saccharopolyspora erythraea NRRL 2338]|uniref:PAS domain S-box-containing protein/diguanylate cyclase (GGDEF)-like protein n=1 Tax=Saccharopolyspora erythraea TaxID=1836 RepID=A0ABP3N089_SACER|nr:PAS domain S-box-containing protein/diguanylate cyclase (GGDEF)-like protein [Saccharopolyspora erythraea NRRL 2338]